jgi:hypothetical protein
MTRRALMTMLCAMGSLMVAAGMGPGCAGPTAESRAAAACPIPQLPWDAADEGGAFNRARSAELTARLASVAAEDQRAAQAGQPIGERLTALGRETASTAIISKPTAQLAERLRQLECAVQRGAYARNPQMADRLFGQILGELDREQVALGGGAKDRTATR